MKRRLFIVAVFLLAGAVVNVAVAWGVILLLDRWDWTYENVTSRRVEWPRDVPDHWPQADTIYGWKDFGFLRRSYVSASTEVRSAYSINTTRAGWPCLSLEWEIWEPTPSAVPPDGWNQELPMQITWRSGLPAPSKPKAFSRQGPERLPVHPLWPGFAVNTIFYAVVLWLLIPGPFVLRRFIRRRRGLCPKCGYPMGQNLPCLSIRPCTLPRILRSWRNLRQCVKRRRHMLRHVLRVVRPRSWTRTWFSVATTFPKDWVATPPAYPTKAPNPPARTQGWASILDTVN